jgi:apolipoprotein N-acyltransferase
MKRICLISALSGFAFSLAFPPFRFDLFAWIALVPLFWTFHSSTRTSSAAICGFVFGLVFFSFDTSWIFRTLVIHGHFGFISAAGLFVAMMVTLALFPALFALLTKLFAHKGFGISLVAPFVWTSTEFLRGVVFTGFPWDLAGYSQTCRLSIMQMTDITGIYGVSFVIVMVNGLLWQAVDRISRKSFRAWIPIITAVFAITLVSAYGTLRLRDFPVTHKDQNYCKVGILQGNIPQEIKWDKDTRHKTIRTYEKLGKKAVEQGAKLLVWPETSIPVLFNPGDKTWKQAFKVSEEMGVPMVVGAPTGQQEAGHTHYYNSAFLLEGKSLRYRYDKIHLVPFGEYVPLSWLLPVGPGIAAREADFTPGKDMTVMSTDNCPKFSVLICYEVIFPRLSRWALRKGAQMLITITNDGWFGHSAAPYQHFEMARVRSIENRVWLIRSANTGISGVFDPAGRTVAATKLNTQASIVVPIPSKPSKGSFYLRWGDLFAWACIGIIAALIIYSILSRKSNSTKLEIT